MRRAGIGLTAVLLAALVGGCASMGPATVPRDRADYGAAIGDSWKQQTLMNIVRLRYADFPVFMEIAQVIAGYQLQTTAAAGFSIQNFLTSAVGTQAAVAGTTGVGATYVDRPTVIYAPLTGNDFIKKLMAPIPPAAVLFLLQSGYSATLVMHIAVDSINGVANESRRPAMQRPPNPQFVRLAELLYELQRANALQIRIERARDTDVSVITFPPIHDTSETGAKISEVRQILRLSGRPPYAVHYGGYSGKGDDIAIATRSMLQIMLEVGTFAEVPEADIRAGRATPVAVPALPAAGARPPLIDIHSGPAAPADAHVAIPYKGRWFWIADTDVRSKSVFGAIMLLFAISDVGVRTAPPVVTVPAN
jgi:hypothetical protein